MMSAVCSICGKATKAPHSCTFCGAIVCEDDYDVETGMCTLCRSRLKRMKKT